MIKTKPGVAVRASPNPINIKYYQPENSSVEKHHYVTIAAKHLQHREQNYYENWNKKMTLLGNDPFVAV